ncbi:hypothetical protein N9E50_03380 [Alphaproteobacteria bacterium]|nr:hypothetical protein [Alphaproteobacteria bacterium]
MNWIKNSILVIISTLVAIKGVDIFRYYGSEIQLPLERKGQERYLLLINKNNLKVM